MTAASIGLLLLILLVIGGVSFWRLAHAVDELERAQYGRLATETRSRLERLVSRDRSRLKEAAFSDELYALIERGPAPPDSFVRPLFADWFPRLYGDEFVGLYGLDGTPLFVRRDGPADLATVAVTNPLLRMLDNREPAAGLVRRGDQLYWVAGVPVLPTNYGDASQPIRGYLVVARTFGPAAVAGLVGDRPLELRLRPATPRKTPVRAEVRALAAGDSALVTFALADVFAQQSTLAELVTSRGEFRAVARSFRIIGFMGALFLVGFAGLAWWATGRWVVAPASRLAAALEPVHQGQIPALLGSPAPVTEWTSLTGAINRLVANLRAAHERVDRVSHAVRDGAWEQEFATGEWTFSSRFRALLDFPDNELPATAQIFEQLIHPDDREVALVTLQASAGSGRPIDLEVRLRRRSGDYGHYRLQASVQTDAAGAPIRFLGRLIDLTPERAADAALAEANARTERARRNRGRLLLHLGAELEHPRSDAARRATVLGQALTETLVPDDAAFDLYRMIEESAERAGASPSIAVAPGVPHRVSGDAGLIGLALTELIRNAGRGDEGRSTVRVDRPDGGSSRMIRFTVIDRGSTITGRDQQRILALLQNGEPVAEGQACGIGLLLIHEIVRRLGGTTAAEFPADGGTAIGFALALAPVEETYATIPESADPQSDLGWSTPDANATFEAVADPALEVRSPRPSGPMISLVADETVVIDLDGPEPKKRGARAEAAPAILTQLAGGGQTAGLARQVATIFLKDAPIRLVELKGAVKAGDLSAAATSALALEGMAKLVGATELAEHCRAAIEAFETAPIHQAARSVDGIRHELEQFRRRLEPAVGGAAEPSGSSRPPIDPETLEQIRASLTADGQGLGTQLVGLFLAEVPDKLAVLEEAAGRTDQDALRRAADDLKGMCGLVGAGPMAELCDGLAAGSGDRPVAVRVAAVRAEFERVRSALGELAGAASA